MTNDWCSDINSACPLTIERVLWDGHSLVLSGPEWSFACTSPFRVIEGERMIAGWEDKRIGAAVAELESLRVVQCESLIRPASGDLRLVLSDGRALEVFTTSTIDPWVFRVPTPPIIIPSPTSPGWYGAGD
jgi:hypothetical protein